MRRIAVALALALLAGACGGDDDGRPAPTTTSTTERAGSATTAEAGGDGPGTTAAGGGTAVPTTTRAGEDRPPAAASARQAYDHTPAGTYRYRITGEASSPAFGTRKVDGPATLAVDPPSGADQGSRLTAEGTRTDQVLRFGDDGVRLVSIRTSQQGLTKEFRPEPPGPVLPFPLRQGQTWRWAATSTDGKTTVEASFRYDRDETLEVAGRTLRTWVLEATVSTTGDVRSTSHQTIWYARELRLIARQHDVTDGTFGQVAFHSDTTRTLEDTAG